MAIGLITSPSSWSLGTIVAPTWLQNVQDNINGMLGGTGPTLKALQIDGTGGNASSQASGTISVSGTGASGTSLPTPTIAAGNIYKELIPFAYGTYTATSGTTPTMTLVQGFNVSTIARSNTGLHIITFVTAATNGAKMVVVANGNVASGSAQLFCSGLANTNATFNITLFNSSGAFTDPTATTTINFICYGV